MPTALPTAASATGSSVTEADFKNWIAALHDFLAGLLGTTGAASDALAALGISGAVVSTFNSRTGAVMLTSGDVVGALGFTPPSSQLLPAGNAVGALALTYKAGAGLVVGTNYSGFGDSLGGGFTGTGTWKCLSSTVGWFDSGSGSNAYINLLQRIA